MVIIIMTKKIYYECFPDFYKIPKSFQGLVFTLVLKLKFENQEKLGSTLVFGQCLFLVRAVS